LIGTTLSQYRILEKIGEGGMGEVYLAEDTSLKRKVALKVLPAEMAADPERLARFKREAESVAALNHPNIVTIHSVEEVDGTHFLTMEWVDGQTLGELMSRGAMPLNKIFDLGVPIADALASAHEEGITHRDLKPANVMVNDKGRVKVLDFGLAKLAVEGGEEGSDEQPTQALTQEGLAVGTVPYMSPEQVRGEGVDHRTDIFSLGVMLYEMASGQRPFGGKSSADLVSAILRDRPPSVTEIRAELPHHLGRVLQRCMEKDPERRFQTAKDVKNELEGLKLEVSSGTARLSSASMPAATLEAPSSSSRKGLWIGLAAAAVIALALAVFFMRSDDSETPAASQTAETAGAPASAADDRMMAVVLPFENLGAAEDEYFAAGITDEISGRLASVNSLGVISRQTAARYADSEKSIQQIGEELEVDYVLAGTVRWGRQGDGTSRVRISPELIRVADDRQVWTEAYDRGIEDIFEVQSDIANEVIAALGVTLLGGEQEELDEAPTENVEAFQAFLRARDLSQHGTSMEELTTGVEALYETAVELDPGFVEAWVRLAIHHLGIYTGLDRTEERLSKAKEALEQAEALGRDLPKVRLARGFYHYYGFREYDQALEEFRKASETLPNDSEMRESVGLIYRRKGKLEEAIAEFEAAEQLDPQNANVLTNLSSSYRAMRRAEETLAYDARLVELSPEDDDVYSNYAQHLFALKGDLERAREEFERAPGSSEFLPFNFAFLFMNERNFVGAIELVEPLTPTNPLIQAFRFTILGWAKYLEYGLEEARSDLESANELFASALEQAPSNSQFRTVLGLNHLFLEDSDTALREVRLAVDLESKDAYAGPVALENLAIVYAWSGRIDDAFRQIERLLAMDYQSSLTTHRLNHEFWWDPLRDDPRFLQLIEAAS
jgi:serine/threonine protein kinase/TolB-like protein/Flp pilus assembly protein TadD